MKRLLLISLLALLCGTLPARTPSRQVESKGSPHIFTVLVEFRNVRFTSEKPCEQFDKLLNGPVRQYFSDNSQGLFTPSFDVFGPVLLDAPMADFGRDILSEGVRVADAAPEKALLNACAALDGEVDFARYDADGDGFLDMVLFYYAGYDQAAGGPADAIWSHHQDACNSRFPEVAGAVFDGVRLGYYFCTGELRGSTGSQCIGIGSTVHEMGHALGLPDLYDTNAGQDGMAGGLYQFSPMSSGLYNDDGDTPPHFTVLERMMLGWLDEEDLLPLQEGWVELAPASEGAAGISRTATDGEFFLYEFRDGKEWDTPLPAGLLVYHVDRSKRMVGGVPAFQLWDQWRDYNSLNANGMHPCCYAVPPMAPKDYNYAPAVNPATLVFPGVGEVRCFRPVDWENASTGIQITCIDLLDGKARFRVLEREGALVSGLVLDDAGGPVAQVSVRLLKDGKVVASDVTGMDGCYLLPVREENVGRLSLVLDKAGYRRVNETIDLESNGLICKYLRLFSNEAPASMRLFKYDPSLSAGYFPSASPVIGAVRFTPEDLARYVGGRLDRVVCFPFVTHPERIGEMYITVDIGGERVLNHLVENPELGEYLPVSVSLAPFNLSIPEGVDIYVGYGFREQGDNTPLAAVYPGKEGNSYYVPFGFETQRWQPLYMEKAGFYMDIMLDTFLQEVPAGTLAEMGYGSILLREGPYLEGERLDFGLQLPEGLRILGQAWTWDGEALADPFVTLTEGEHTLEVCLRYPDGREEYLAAEVFVN